MKLIKISALMMAIAYASATDQNMFHNGDRIANYVVESSEVADKFEPRINFSEKYQTEVAESGRSIRAASHSNSSERFKQNEPSKAYYFDYLVKENPARSRGNLHFHVQEKDENGTVKGVYGHAHRSFGYITVRYVADAKGYRAKVEKGEAVPSISKYFGLSATRDSGKVEFGMWGEMGLAGVVQNLYTPGNKKKSKDYDEEEED